ncbi:MAG: hypothetical protein PHD32_07250 [Eubacteriales bacterium]|nr:hypothetical protein [Eubacteriales bacterium]
MDERSDVHPHPRTTMETGMEFLTTRPLKVELLCTVPCPTPVHTEAARRELERLKRGQ